MIDTTEHKKVENDLRQSEERYRRITESLTDYCYSVRIENGVPVETVHGPTCVVVTGYTSEQFASDPHLWIQMVHEEDRPLVEKQFSQIYSEQRGEPLEHRIVRKDGALRWIRNTPVFHFDKRGELISYDGLIQDITERKKTEEELKESERRFRTIFNDARDGILLADIENRRFSTCNKALCKMLGYTEEEIKNLGVKDIHPEQDLPYVIEQFEKQMKEEIKLAPSLPVRKRDGSIFYADIVSSPVMIAGKKYLLGSFRDITERKRAEEELEETRDYLDNLIESSLDCIIVGNSTGTIIRVNEAFLKLVGYQNEEIIGKHIMELSITEEGTYKSTTGETVKIDKEFFDKAREMTYEKLFQEGKITNWETYYLRKDNKIVPVEMNVAYLYNVEGAIIGSVGINRDITERKKVEREVRAARDFLENIFKTSADGIIVNDSKGFISMVNDAASKILGYPQDELLGKHSLEFGPQGELYEKGKELVTRLYEKGVAIGEEQTWVRKNGSLMDIEINAALLQDSEGNPTGSVSSIRDITERKKAEKEIAKTRDFLENIFKTTLDGLVVTDDEGVITMVNEAVKKMLGYSQEELIGKSTSTFKPVGKVYDEISEKYLTKLFEDEAVTAYEMVWLKKDGSVITVEANGILLKDDQGNITRSVASIRDITEKKKAEEALKKSEKRYHNLIEFANIGIIAAEHDKITYVNRRAGEIYGYSREELIEKSPGILTPEKYRKKHREILNEFLTFEEGSKIVFEEEGIRKDGSLFPVEISFALTQPDENIIIAIVRDTTEKKQMEQQLLQSEKLKSLGELSGGVAHDFNNVLAAILGRVQLLRMQLEPPPGKQEKRKSMLDLKKGLEVIERAAMDGAETVRRIQEFSRRRADDKDFTQVDINELIDSALEFTRVRWKDEAESKGIKFIVTKELSPLPPTAGSEAELREVFVNLINNGLDAMPQGGRMTIRAFNENNQICVIVKDTGIGIPKTLRENIFDPFFTTKGPQSTGLGLSVSYGIINRHRGTITVDSIEGQGTTFSITLPISEKILKEEKVKPISGEQRKARILVIEDEEEVRNVLSDILTTGGHEVEVAADGIQGVKLFTEKEFDLVFTDLGMPVMSGWQVAEKIKGINGRVPVALITGWNVKVEASEMKDKYVDLVIQKPFEIHHVLRLVQEGMELRDRFKTA